MRRTFVVLAALLGLLAGPSAAEPAKAPLHAMVVAANPLAAQAGLKVLREGGSAVDAAVAIQAVLGLVEPQSSGLGGGGFMTFYDARTRKVTAYDGREVAPAGASADMFVDHDDAMPMDFFQAVLSGRSAGVPGAVAMLALAQKEHGARPWSALFGDAETLADEGFGVSPRLDGMIHSRAPQASSPDSLAYFGRPDGTKLKAGDVLKNPTYAATLRRLAAEGAAALYEGPIAQAIVARVGEAPLPGSLTLADLKAYKPKAGEGLCRPYRVYVVCTPQPPSGGIGVLEALGLLERTDIATRGPNDPRAWLELAEAERLMYADRDHYVGDPAFVRVPVEGLLDPTYLAARAALIGDKAGPAPTPGRPPGSTPRSPDATREPGGTSHFVVVDAKGNVVSMTTSVESIFGDGRRVAGYYLNNQLTDFSFSPTDPDGAPAANAVAPGKRPRSSMAPVIVLDRQGRFVAAVGSPGGPAILGYDLKALVGLLDWKLTMQQAIDLPNLVAKGDAFYGEIDKFPPGVVEGLAALGVTLKRGQGEDSGLHGVVARPGGLEGGADPRREGVAVGY